VDARCYKILFIFGNVFLTIIGHADAFTLADLFFDAKCIRSEDGNYINYEIGVNTNSDARKKVEYSLVIISDTSVNIVDGSFISNTGPHLDRYGPASCSSYKILGVASLSPVDNRYFLVEDIKCVESIKKYSDIIVSAECVQYGNENYIDYEIFVNTHSLSKKEVSYSLVLQPRSLTTCTVNQSGTFLSNTGFNKYSYGPVFCANYSIAGTIQIPDLDSVNFKLDKEVVCLCDPGELSGASINAKCIKDGDGYLIEYELAATTNSSLQKKAKYSLVIASLEDDSDVYITKGELFTDTGPETFLFGPVKCSKYSLSGNVAINSTDTTKVHSSVACPCGETD